MEAVMAAVIEQQFLDSVCEALEAALIENKQLTTERDELRAEYQQLMAENIVLRTKSNELQAKIEGGVRVYAECMLDTTGEYYECTRDVENATQFNATLILDDGVEI